MFKNLILMFLIISIGTSGIVNAKTKKTVVNEQDAVRFTIPGQVYCPGAETLVKNKKWVEHTGKWDKNLSVLLAKHLSLPIVPVKSAIALSLLPVSVNRGMGITSWSEIIWTVHRSNQKKFIGNNYNCYVLGTVAYYVEVSNNDGWPPEVGFLKKPGNEKQWLQDRTIGLIEFRWYDPVGQRRHRWFNNRLALNIQWVKEKIYSPIPLPRIINSLD